MNKTITRTAGGVIVATMIMASIAGCGDANERRLLKQLPEDSQWWKDASEAVKQRGELPINNGRAKNVILFIGDGMSIPTITAARIFDGQSRGEDGESNSLSFGRMPYSALVKTYTTDYQVPDSAGTASAMNTGVKTRSGVINVNETVAYGDCEKSLDNTLPTLAEFAKLRGKAVGVVTTARVTHATPAAVYAHSPDRNWESDGLMSAQAIRQGCVDIAAQLVGFSYGGGIDVVLGGGSREFLPANAGGNRKEDNLVLNWQQRGGHFVASAKDMHKLDPSDKHPILGLFSHSHMTYMADRSDDSIEPTLSEMTAKAIDLLQRRSRDGYYLMVEGARIDHAHHAGWAGRSLLETQEFARAVQVALDKVDLRDTLVLVTADHAHTLTMAGYPARGNDILDWVHKADAEGKPQQAPALANDGKPYTTLAYANGKGAVKGERAVPETGLFARQQALIPTYSKTSEGEVRLSETHGGDDVALFAVGPKAHWVGGVMEQNEIFHIMAAAFGWQF
ncbi:MAG: alkaline phosphatase [Gammaproteobacteria bacterium]|nr:MAG: alkaline phosphatase [Gammaproteobacteria bacterium]